jgi:hypothetical protein
MGHCVTTNGRVAIAFIFLKRDIRFVGNVARVGKIEAVGQQQQQVCPNFPIQLRFLRNSLSFLNMPTATKTTTATTSSGSKRATTDMKIPVKSDGTKDKRYVAPQFVKSDGTRDMRTTLTSQRR